MSARGNNDLQLSRIERLTLAIGEYVNERTTPKALQSQYHRLVCQRWIYQAVRNLLHIEGLENVMTLSPARGVLLCSNHRSFFDQFVLSILLLRNTSWAKELYFPVRANFFYETLSGLAVNLLVGGGVMYPPIFREHARADLNKDSLDRLAKFLERPGAVVGIHPEGTRGKGPDPYQLLPAQPGGGQVALMARPTIIPAWVNGLSNDLFRQIAANFRPAKAQRIIVVFGKPVELGALAEGKPRLAQYKRVADRILDDIRTLGEQERRLRAAL